jgi:hypothetical protein
MQTKQQSPFSQAAFWQPNRKPFFVCGAFRQNAMGDPIYPVPESHANCWIILNEIIGPGDGLRTLIVFGQFVNRDMAEWICDLILQNRPQALS